MNGDKMIIKDIMTKDMVVASPNNTIQEVSSMMNNYDIGFLPIESDNDFIGVITDRDIIIRAIALGKDSKEPIEKYMTDYIISIPSDTTLENAINTMANEQVKRLLVEEDKKIVGLVSLSDILHVSDNPDFLEYVKEIFEPLDEVVITNEIDIPQAEVDEFEL